MTYADLKLNDGEILNVLFAARKYNVTTMVHCENADVYVFYVASQSVLTNPPIVSTG